MEVLEYLTAYRVLIWAMLNGFEITEWWSLSHWTVGVWMLSYKSLLIFVPIFELVIFGVKIFSIFSWFFKSDILQFGRGYKQQNLMQNHEEWITVIFFDKFLGNF